MNLIIKTVDDEEFILDVNEDWTLLDLKLHI